MNEQIDSTPKRGFLRLPQILGDPKADPPIPALIPLAKSTWWAGIRQGRYPKPVKLSERTSAWLRSDIDALCDQIAAQQTRKAFLHDQAAELLRADDPNRYELDAKRHEEQAKQLREAATALRQSQHGL